jgi:HEAT repeat protein
MPIGKDLTTWQQWWDYNQDEHLPFTTLTTVQTASDDFYLGSTRRVEVLANKVDAGQVRDVVLPALKQAIEQGPRDVTVAGLIALARIGVDHPTWRLSDVLASRLHDQDQSVRETAALALGLAAHTDGRRRLELVSILRDATAGRALVGREVGERTRAFAAYGLGLHANRSKSNAAKRAVFEALSDVLRDRSVVGRDVRVAALQSIGLLNIDRRSYHGARLAHDVMATLDAFFTEDRGVGEQQVQAHCPTAIARLLDAGDSQAERYKERFAAILQGKRLDGKRRGRVLDEVAQSCALALGQLVRADEDGDVDANRDVRFSEVLRQTWKKHKDTQTRNFAAVALGQIGGAKNREFLLRQLGRSSRSLEQPWCALALGLCAADRRGRTGEQDVFVGETLLKGFRRAKNPAAVGAFAVSLGLARFEPARPHLAGWLDRNIGKEQAAASVCQALSMFSADASRESLRSVLPACDRRPQLFEEAARALGRLGEDAMAETLLRRLSDHESNYEMRRSLAFALGDIGTREQVAPLVDLVGDRDRSAVTRAGAALALGGIVDRRPARWNTPLRANTNYRASVATLTDRFRGVLDLR